MQRLITKDIERSAPGLGATEHEADPVAVAHLFSALAGWDWYIVEYDPRGREAFGYVRGLEGEWGYFSLSEMEGLNRERGVAVVERDARWRPRPVSEVLAEIG